MTEGMILAAGLGTRLGAITASRPKALVEVGGCTLLERAIARLHEAGVEHIIVNVHHFADMVADFILSHSWPCQISISDERAMLLDTGGALQKASSLMLNPDGQLLVHNADVLSSFDLGELIRQHISCGNFATLCASKRDTTRGLVFDHCGHLLGRDSDGLIPPDGQRMAFSGIAMVSGELLKALPEAVQPYPIIDRYIEFSKVGRRVMLFSHLPSQWLDVGRPETLKKAEWWLKNS